MDWTYRAALNARLAQLYQDPSADHGERAWGEGETESLERFLNKTRADVTAEVVAAVRATGEAIARAAESLCELIASIVVRRREIDQARYKTSVANRVRPIRALPGGNLRPLLHDQRPQIQQQYAWRRS